MRHFLAPLAIAAHPGGMRHTTAPAALVTATSLAQAGSACGLRAVAIAVSLAAITTATDDDLRPATGAHVQAARGRLHWRLLQNAKDEEESNEVDGPREQCDTDGSHGSPAGRQACHMDTLWRRSTGLDLAVEAGAAPVFLLRQTPFYHADGRPDSGHVSSRPKGSLRRALNQRPVHCASNVSAMSVFMRA